MEKSKLGEASLYENDLFSSPADKGIDNRARQLSTPEAH
jgi:hypothetical protein